jgi:2-polyprenyl-3-methyl-5-hydroxy-6-metoxy-1,4-benzoquinol methylase
VEDQSKIVLTCKDHTATNEPFDLILNEELGMLITSPKPEESNLSKYYESDAYISHTDSSKSLIDKIYQIVKNYTIRKKVKLIASLQTEGASILDIGCGTGDFLAAAKNKGWSVVGIEPNENAKNLAIKKVNTAHTKVSSFYKNIEAFLKDKGDEKFDVITMWHVLEHVYNLEDYIRNLEKLLKPNGSLLIAVPNYNSFDAKYYGKFWAAYDVPRHLWHFSQKSIAKLFGENNMEVIQTIPMKFDSYYVSLLSEKYKTGSSNPLKAFKIGFQSNLKAATSKEYSSLIYILKKAKNVI